MVGQGTHPKHIRVALQLGLTPQDILEAIEIALPEAGVVAFRHGFYAWRETVGATGLEPSQIPDGTAGSDTLPAPN
jgi:4-carboxymuconolactone decarboxylase